MTRVKELQKVLRQLRSGSAREILDAEHTLMRMARVGPTSMCSCENYPHVRSRDCFAHAYIPISVAESQEAEGGTDMRSIIAMIRRRTGAAKS